MRPEQRDQSGAPVPAEEIAAKSNCREVRIGARMRHARLVKGLTVRELGDRVGCSPSHISKIENDRLRPSLSMLHRLADELSINLSSLFCTGPSSYPYSLMRSEDLPVVRLNHPRRNSGVEIVRLIADTAGALLEAHVHYIEPGAGSGGAIVHQGEELGFILEGELEVTVAGDTFIAREGDCFYYRAHLEHGYRNLGENPARVLWVCTPPS